VCFWNNSVDAISELLKDPRIDINRERTDGSNGPYFAVRDGLEKALLHILWSGKQINMETQGGLLHVATAGQKTRVVKLLQGYVENPLMARHEAGRALGLKGTMKRKKKKRIKSDAIPPCV